MDLLLGAGQGGELGVNPVGAGVTHPHLPPCVCVCVCQPGRKRSRCCSGVKFQGMARTEVSVGGAGIVAHPTRSVVGQRKAWGLAGAL